MKIKTASDLKALYEQNDPEGNYFTRQTMKFYGDTMRNYGVRKVRIELSRTGEIVDGYELYRRRPVKCGDQSSAYFDMNGKIVYGKPVEE